MTTTTDQRVTAGVRAALRKGSLDILGLLRVLRPVLTAELAGHEGSLHVLLHQLVRRGQVEVEGCTGLGLASYRLRDSPPGEDECASPGVAPGPPAATETFAREGLRFAGAARVPEDRARIASDVSAHLRELGTDRPAAFGPQRAARHHLRRVDRGRRTVIFASAAGEGLRRFLLHEGPWLLAAVVVFFVVRAFLAEVFVIPSGSMIPTLLPGDRVIVVKPGGSGMPERWRITTFERGGITYVKRAVGLGGEAFALIDGDVYADGKLLVKPEAARKALRFPYRAWDLGHPEDAPDWARTQNEADGTATWTYAGAPLWSAGILHPRRPLADVLLRDVYADLVADRPAGASVELALDYAHPNDVSTGEETSLVLRVADEGVSLAGRAGDAGKRFVPLEGGAVPAVGWTRLTLSCVDGILRARVGDATWTSEIPLAPGMTVTPRIVASEGVRGLKLTLDKDIHYSLAGELAVPGHVSDEAPGSYAFRIPDGYVFFLGDNTHDSRDSRYRVMGPILASDLIGPVSLRIWPVFRIGFVR